MTNFEKVLRSIIKKSGGSPDKFKLSDFMEKLSHSFAFAPLNYWLGVTIMKNPLDLAILQQIIFDKKPDTIIECGTAYGGSAYYMACMMDLANIDGKVITIDHEPNQTNNYHRTDFIAVFKNTPASHAGDELNADMSSSFRGNPALESGEDAIENNDQLVSLHVQELKKASHPKIEYVISDCLNAHLPKVGKKAMVILDCHHSPSHVYKELVKYSQLVTVGQYLIVEDTDHNTQRGGPAAAVARFLKENKSFIIDKSREKYGISSNIGGYLVRVS